MFPSQRVGRACVIICLSITVLPSLGYGELCLTKSILHASPIPSNNPSQATGGTSRSRWRKERNQKKAPPWAMTEGWWTPFRGRKKLNTQFTKLNHTSVKSHFYCNLPSFHHDVIFFSTAFLSTRWCRATTQASTASQPSQPKPFCRAAMRRTDGFSWSSLANCP